MSASEPSVALVFSPEGWVEDLHRHLSHHGGARVRLIVVEPSVALEEDYDVLVVSDRWPALTYGFVGAVHDRGRNVLGVFDPDEPAGKDHLVDLGVDATIASDAAVAEFVAVLHELDAGTDAPVRRPRRARRGSSAAADEAPSGRVVAVSGPRGSGVSEVALGLAVALTERQRSVVLLDAHEAAPALGGPPGPRSRTEPPRRGRRVSRTASARSTTASCRSSNAAPDVSTRWPATRAPSPRPR